MNTAPYDVATPFTSDVVDWLELAKPAPLGGIAAHQGPTDGNSTAPGEERVPFPGLIPSVYLQLR